MQFLAKLRPEYETVRSTLLARNIGSIDEALPELLREEKRITTQVQVDNNLHGTNSAFAISSGPRGMSEFGQNHDSSSLVGYSNNSRSNSSSTRPQFASKVPGNIRCHYCQESGHIQPHCRKRNLCTYCKRTGHIILDCPKLKNRPRHATTAGGSLTVPTGGATCGKAFAAQQSFVADSCTSGSSNITPEYIDALIQRALQKALPTALNVAFTAADGIGNIPWLLDSAAFNHMTHLRSKFQNLHPVRGMSLEVANGNRVPVEGIGDMGDSNLHLSNTLYVPQLVPNLVSVGQLAEQGCRVCFDNTGCVVQDVITGKKIGQGSKIGRVYKLDRCDQQNNGSLRGLCFNEVAHSSRRHLLNSDLNNGFAVGCSNNVWELWHSRLGHPHSARLEFMFKNNFLPDKLKLDSVSASASKCMSCVGAKMSQLPFSSSKTEIGESFHLIHTDLWGPSPVISRLGYRYFVLFIDHATRFTWVYFLRLKSELFNVIQEFVKMVQTQFNKTIKIIRSDPGGEFTSNHLHGFYRSQGILSQQSCPGVSQQNGLVERKHRHVLELTRAILLHSHVPPHFWVEAVHTVVHVINRQVTPTLQNQSPYYSLYSKFPDYSRLRIFGCVCYVLLASRERNKLSSKTAKCMFIGYTDTHKGYLCYDFGLRRLRISRDVIFFENMMYYDSPSIASNDGDSLRFLEPTSTFTDDVAAIDELPSTLLSLRDSDNSSPSSSSPPTTTIHTDQPIVNPSTTPSTDPLSTDSSSQPSPIVLRRSTCSTQGQPSSYLQENFVTYATTPISVPRHYKHACGDPNWEKAMQVELML
ncbi:Retrovirus-related Pol polyprotein from transposon RE1 [Linum grandiflorum]